MATVITYEIADVSCILCGRFCGTAKRSAPGAPLLFRETGSDEWTPVRSITTRRCPHCGGSLYLDEFETRREFTPEAFAEEDAARPRRGRPPRPFRIPSQAA